MSTAGWSASELRAFLTGDCRKNLFIDLESGLGWTDAGDIFDRLWSRPSFTYPEIVDLSYHLEERLLNPTETTGPVHGAEYCTPPAPPLGRKAP